MFSLWRYAAFYTGDIEIHPGPVMNITGDVDYNTGTNALLQPLSNIGVPTSNTVLVYTGNRPPWMATLYHSFQFLD